MKKHKFIIYHNLIELATLRDGDKLTFEVHEGDVIDIEREGYGSGLEVQFNSDLTVDIVENEVYLMFEDGKQSVLFPKFYLEPDDLKELCIVDEEI